MAIAWINDHYGNLADRISYARCVAAEKSGGKMAECHSIWKIVSRLLEDPLIKSGHFRAIHQMLSVRTDCVHLFWLIFCCNCQGVVIHRLSQSFLNKSDLFFCFRTALWCRESVDRASVAHIIRPSGLFVCLVLLTFDWRGTAREGSESKPLPTPTHPLPLAPLTCLSGSARCFYDNKPWCFIDCFPTLISVSLSLFSLCDTYTHTHTHTYTHTFLPALLWRIFILIPEFIFDSAVSLGSGSTSSVDAPTECSRWRVRSRPPSSSSRSSSGPGNEVSPDSVYISVHFQLNSLNRFKC